MRCNPNPFPDWHHALDGLLAAHETTLLQDPQFINNAFDPAEIDPLQLSPNAILSLLAGEAKKSLVMIAPYLQPGMRVLEIGGGVGLVYALLRMQGIDIISLEPGSEGFGDRHRAGLRLIQLVGVDADGWVKTGIERYRSSAPPFDLVFSYFVLEHVTDLDLAFAVMADNLSKNGLMVHRCPNYTVPFEPHYNIPLMPFKPEWTPFFYAGLQQKGLWRGLKFTSVRSITRLCKRHGLQPVFRPGMTAEAFERVLGDPDFSARKKGFAALARMVKATGMMKVLGNLPAALCTPMEFTAEKTSG